MTPTSDFAAGRVDRSGAATRPAVMRCQAQDPRQPDRPRIAEAEREGWHSEVEGLKISLAVTILRLAGQASIDAALRHHARRPDRPLRTIMIS